MLLHRKPDWPRYLSIAQNHAKLIPAGARRPAKVGWDPYDVWKTRVRDAWLEQKIAPR